MLTIIGNIGDLEATGTVGLACLEVDPELPGAGCEGDGALVGLASLIGGNGGWGGWEGKQHVRGAAGMLLKPSWSEGCGRRNPAERCHLFMHCPHPHTYIVSHPPELVPQFLFDILALTKWKKIDI